MKPLLFNAEQKNHMLNTCYTPKHPENGITTTSSPVTNEVKELEFVALAKKGSTVFEILRQIFYFL